MKAEVIERIRDFADEIENIMEENPELFYYNEDYGEGVYYTDGDEPLETFGRINAGVSKMAFMDADDEVIIKVPFIGTHFLSYYDKDGNELEDPQPAYEDYDVDYCTIEHHVWQDAVKAGLEKFFFEEKKISTRIYVQKRCNTPFTDYIWANDELRKTAEAMADFICEYLESFHLDCLVNHFSCAALLKLIDENTHEDLIKLNDFMYEHSINDTTDNNIGVDENGRLKMFDYSGYGD